MTQLAPLQKVIWWKKDGFAPGQFVVAWICAGKRMPPIVQYDKRVRVKVTRYEKEAIADKGVFANSRDVQPYNGDTWAAIERLVEQEEGIDQARKQLRKGKLPVEQVQIGMGL